MSQKRFWCHDNQRLPEWQGDLSAQDVEVICGSGTIGNDHVDVGQLFDGEFVFQRWEIFGIIGAKLEETFGSGRRVFGAHTFHTVRKEQD